jgi:hypothetical protein
MEAHRLGEISEKLSALAKEKKKIMLEGASWGYEGRLPPMQRHDFKTNGRGSKRKRSGPRQSWRQRARRRGHSESWRRQRREYKRRGEPWGEKAESD